MSTPTQPGNIFKLAVRLAASLAAAAAIFTLSALAIVPEGELILSSDLKKPAPYLSSPKPDARLAEQIKGVDGRILTPLVSSPVYFDLDPPLSFESVRMTVDYENSGHSLVELGALGSSLDYQFDMRSGEARLIDSLPWTRVSGRGLILIQRSPKYGSVDDFISHPPEPSRVVSYMAGTSLPMRLDDYSPADETRTMEITLRGHHRMFTYVKGEPLAFSFFVQDMNREAGADPVIVSVYRNGSDEVVSRAILEDDGDTKGDQKASKLRVVSVSLIAPPEGAYQIEFTAPNDVFIRQIATRQSKLVFAGKIYLGDRVGYSDVVRTEKVLTNGRKLVARTAHLDSLQTLTVGKGPLSLDTPSMRYIRDLPPGRTLTTVISPKADILLETDGIFALHEDDYFDPFPLALQWYDDRAALDARGVDYILTSYKPPSTPEVGLSSISAEFKTADLAKTEDGAYRFVIAAPGIDITKQEVRIARISFTMKRQPLGWRNFWGTLGAMFAPSPSATGVLPTGKTFGEMPQ